MCKSGMERIISILKEHNKREKRHDTIHRELYG